MILHTETRGNSYHDDKWGILPDKGDVSPHVKGMVQSIDKSVGRIVATLRRLDLAGNTLVIFTSDNGGYLSYDGGFENISSNGPLRGQKTEVYEGGHRVPSIAWWPGRIEPSVSADTIMSFDLFPTFLSLAGASAPGLRRHRSVATTDRSTEAPRKDVVLENGRSAGGASGAVEARWRRFEFPTFRSQVRRRGVD